MSFERERPALLLPMEPASSRGDYSEATAREIDCEVRRIIAEQHGRAHDRLAAQEDVLREAAMLLQQKEVITGVELADIRARRATGRVAS